MKKNFGFVAMFLVVGFSCIAVATAGEGTTLRVAVPFDFHVGKELLPAGTYIIQIDRVTHGTAIGSKLVVRNSQGTDLHVVSAIPGSSKATGARLVFRKYEQAYFLSKVSSYGITCEVTRSKAEKQTAARLESQQQDVAVAAE